VYIPVWNPQEGPNERTIRNLTLDIVGDEDALNSINCNLADEIAKYGADDSETSDIERYISGYLHSMLRMGLIWDASCSDHGVTDVASLKSRLEDDDFEVFPL
jgi:hypothetical protein